jgi:ParB-like chromosome segregation protein Spo0J
MTKRTIPAFDPKKLKLSPGHAVAGETRRVPVADIHVLDNLNLRVKGTAEYDAAVDEFAASIEANGFYDDKPLAGYLDSDGRVIVIDGHRRLEAVARLNGASLDGDIVKDVPVVLKPEDSTLADLTVAMIQSSSGRELTMFEKGIGVRRLMADGMDKDEISRRLGVTAKTIDNYLTVASVSAKARDLLLDDKVTSTQVLRAKGDAGKLQAMVEKATAAGRTRARPSDAETTPVIGPNDGALPPEPSEVMTTSDPDAIRRIAQAIVNADKPDDGLTFTVTIAKDSDMGAVLRQIAADVRKVVPHSQGDDDVAFVDGTITVSIALVQPEKPKRKSKAQAPQPAAEEPVPAELAHAIPADEL